MKVQNPAVRTESYESYRMYGRACPQRLIQVTDSDVGNPIGLQSHPDTNHVTCLWGGEGGGVRYPTMQWFPQLWLLTQCRLS